MTVSRALLDGVRPSRTPHGIVMALTPQVAYAFLGAAHWRQGRRRRAVAIWVRVAAQTGDLWATAVEAPVEVTPTCDVPDERARQQRRDIAALVPSVAIAVAWDLNHPRGLTAPVVAISCVRMSWSSVRLGRAVYKKRPRMAVAKAFSPVAESALLWALRSEPLD